MCMTWNQWSYGNYGTTVIDNGTYQARYQQ